jgi:hypothetical protein
MRIGLAAKVAYGSETDKPAEASFLARAKLRVKATNSVFQFSTGQEIRKWLRLASDHGPLTHIDIFSHGFVSGVIGANSGDIGLYDDTYKGAAGSEKVSNIVQDVWDGEVLLAKKCEISFWGCESWSLAQTLSELLGEDRSDVTVIGAEGSVYPMISKGTEIGATADVGFRSYHNGNKKGLHKSRTWADPAF